MDPSVTERLTRRVLEGMKYETNRSGPPDDFPRLPRIPGGRYNDPAFLESERRGLWKRTWLYACHSDELPRPAASCCGRDRLADPHRARQGLKIRAFYNTCRHRGGPLVKQAQGHCDGLVCWYHGWTYALDGQLINLRDKRDFVGLDMAAHSLTAVRCERFDNWVFVNEDPEAQPLLEHSRSVPGSTSSSSSRRPCASSRSTASTSSATSRCCSMRFSRSIT